MKKLFTILFILYSAISMAQGPGVPKPSNYTWIAHRYDWLSGKFRGLTLPAGTTPALIDGQYTGAGAVFVDSVNHRFYFYSGGVWRFGGGIDSVTSDTDSSYIWQGGDSFGIAKGGFFSPDQTSLGNTIHNGGGYNLTINNIGELVLEANRIDITANDSLLIHNLPDIGGEAADPIVYILGQTVSNKIGRSSIDNINQFGRSDVFLGPDRAVDLTGNAFKFFDTHPTNRTKYIWEPQFHQGVSFSPDGQVKSGLDYYAYNSNPPFDNYPLSGFTLFAEDSLTEKTSIKAEIGDVIGGGGYGHILTIETPGKIEINSGLADAEKYIRLTTDILNFNFQGDPIASTSEWLANKSFTRGTSPHVLYYDSTLQKILWGAAPTGGGGADSSAYTEIISIAENIVGFTNLNGDVDTLEFTGVGIDSIYRTPGIDSFYYIKGDTVYAVKDSIGSGGGTSSFGIIQNATYTLTSSTSLQKLFDANTTGEITVAANTTYQFECFFSMSDMSATSGNCGFSIIGGGTATAFSANWSVVGRDGGSLVTATNSTGMFSVNTAETGNIVAAATTTNMFALVKGTIRINGGGTIIPSVNLTNAAAATVGINSYFKLTPIGNGTITSW